MAIYQTGGYRVKPSAVEKVKEVIRGDHAAQLALRLDPA